MGQIDDMGLVSPKSKNGVDVILLCLRSEISQLCYLEPSELLLRVRSNEEALRIVMRAKVATTKTSKKELLRSYGLEKIVCCYLLS